MAFYVILYLLLPNGREDPGGKKSGPFSTRPAAEQFAIAAGARTNVARVEIIESGVADFGG